PAPEARDESGPSVPPRAPSPSSESTTRSESTPEPPRVSRPAREPDVSASAPAAPAFGDVDVRVASRRDARGELRDYVVTLRDAAGAAFTGADVRLQRRMADPPLVEVVPDPSSLPGAARAAGPLS